MEYLLSKSILNLQFFARFLFLPLFGLEIFSVNLHDVRERELLDDGWHPSPKS